MKKTFLPLLLVCTSASISAAPEIKDFDIEGIKIGMTEETLKEYLSKTCDRDNNNELIMRSTSNHDTKYGVYQYKTYECRSKGNIYLKIYLRNKVRYIESSQTYKPSGNKTGIKTIVFDDIIKKLNEKYGSPNISSIDKNNNLIVKNHGNNLSRSATYSACWGDCEKKEKNFDRFVNLKSSGLIASVTDNNLGIRLERLLYNQEIIEQDEKDYNKELEIESKNFEDKIKEESKKVTDNIKL